MRKMIEKTICIVVSLLLSLSGISFGMPFRGESELLLNSGLTDNSKQAGGSKSVFKNVFSPGKKIIFWATVTKKKEDVMKYNIQSIEWYAPDGKIWYKDNNYASSSGSFMFDRPGEKTLSFKLSTDAISSDREGVWAVRFVWNSNVMGEHYFTYAKDPTPPTADQINALKNKIKRYEHSIAISNKSNYYKLSSHFARDVKKLYKIQEVFRPDVVFSPNEQIIYMLNYDSTEFGLYSQIPQSCIYLFSPDGKLRKIQDNKWMYDAGDPDYICGFRDKIDFKKLIGDNKDLYGIWKLICYIPIVNQNFDERYFYIGNDLSVEITRDAVEALDKKIDENEIVKSLNWIAQMDRDKAISQGRNKESKVRIDVGMSKDEVLRFIGQPQKILTNKYDDAVVWIYTSASEGVRNSTYSTEVAHGVSSRTNLGTGLIAGGVFIGLSMLMPNKLEIVIKDDIVVSVRGSV